MTDASPHIPTPRQDVFTNVLALPLSETSGEHPALVYLTWNGDRSALAKRLVQVYLDGQLHEVTPVPGVRQMWLTLDRSLPHRIELLAIPIESETDPWQAHPDELNSWQPPIQSRASVELLRDQTLPIDTRITVKVDGQIKDDSPLWPAQAHRGGFGALFGIGGFGADRATGPGFGRGELGYGPFGTDATAWHWHQEALPPGEHQIEITAHEQTGRVVGQPLQITRTTHRLPEPAVNLTLDDEFTLTWPSPIP